MTSLQLPVKTISVESFPLICRTCFGEQNLVPIHNTSIDGIQTDTLMNECIVLNVNNSDALPKQICQNCVLELLKLYKFKKQCHNNDALLKYLLETTQQQQLQENLNENLINIKNEVKIEIDDESENDCDDTNMINLLNEEEDCDSLTVEVEEDTINIDNIEIRSAVINLNEENCESDLNAVKKSKKKQRPRFYGTLKCKRCPETFQTVKDLEEHRKKMKHNVRETCDICQKLVHWRAIYIHARNHADKKYKCKNCEEKFAFKTELVNHRKVHKVLVPENLKFISLDSALDSARHTLTSDHI